MARTFSPALATSMKSVSVDARRLRTVHSSDVLLGVEHGELYSVNVPLRDGIDDDAYFRVFSQTMDAVRGRRRG